jgi:hypothetical protein
MNAVSTDSMNYEQIETLRADLFRLRKEREGIAFEKGLTAQDNKDLRENSTFLYLEQQEHVLTSRILAISREIEKLTRKKK